MFLLESAKGLVGIGLPGRQRHQPGKLQMLAGNHLRAQLVNLVGGGDIHPSPCVVAVEADLKIDAQRFPLLPAPRAPSNAVTSLALSTECTECAQCATDFALLRCRLPTMCQRISACPA